MSDLAGNNGTFPLFIPLPWSSKVLTQRLKILSPYKCSKLEVLNQQLELEKNRIYIMKSLSQMTHLGLEGKQILRLSNLQCFNLSKSSGSSSLLAAVLADLQIPWYVQCRHESAYVLLLKWVKLHNICQFFFSAISLSSFKELLIPLLFNIQLPVYLVLCF